MKQDKLIMVMMVVAGLAATTSCTDFDDYNTAYVDGLNASADKTLWENIEANEQLSTFAKLVKRAGFDKELQSARTYTVWAPLNEAIVESDYEQMDSATLLNDFVKNHIAEYSYGVSGEVDERIRTLNKKAYNFVGTASCTFDDIPVSQVNLPSSNGLIHTLTGVASYYPNGYSYIMDKGEGIDSIKAYFKRYERVTLDVANSVIGPIVDGKQTYIDSVLVVDNTMLSFLRAKLDNEDSTYTLLLPTDKAWNAQYAAVKSKYNYVTKMLAQNLDNSTIETKTINVDGQYVSDSIAKRRIVDNLAFSMSSPYNARLNSLSPQFGPTDTLYSTRYGYLSNPADILSHTVETTQLSNGRVFVVDTLAAQPWDTYNPLKNFLIRSYSARVLNGDRQTSSFITTGIDGTPITYDCVKVVPSGKNSRPELDVYLPEVLSTKYDFYCVYAPMQEISGDSLISRPNRLNFQLNYCNDKGVLTDYNFSSDGASNPKTPVPFVNDPLKKDAAGVIIPDTMYLGQFEFPVSYAGMSGNGIRPNLKITTKINIFSQAEMKTYTREMNLIGIILKPVELDEKDTNKQ